MLGFALDSIDKKLVTRLEQGIPPSQDIFGDLGAELGIGREEVVSRLRRLKERKVIKRLGCSLNMRRLGIASLLAAFEVPRRFVDRFCSLAARCDFVSHCYDRETPHDWRYNVFCVVHAPSLEECERRIRELARLGAASFIIIPAKA